MSELLYKVSAPRDDLTFHPRPFWRSEDWSFSDDAPRDGLVEDHVLYAGSFDEVNIHLLPPVWRLRIWLDDDVRRERLRSLGFTWTEPARALIFAAEADRPAIESFTPTVYAFEPSGFERVPTNEYISRESRTAISAETLSLEQAMLRWRFDVLYVADGDILAEQLRSAGVDHQIQV